MTLRRATPDDAEQVAELLGQLGYPAEVSAVRRRLERLTDSTVDETWLVERGGEIAGVVGLHVSESLEHDGPVAKISELVVDERLRGKGIGRTLMEAAEREARRRGCVLLFLTTAERRQDAHRFYRRLGFEETGRRFAKSLVD
jgi:N-acetylglutamate synthase-like GNAT family acetyltransferase